MRGVPSPGPSFLIHLFMDTPFLGVLWISILDLLFVSWAFFILHHADCSTKVASVFSSCNCLISFVESGFLLGFLLFCVRCFPLRLPVGVLFFYVLV